MKTWTKGILLAGLHLAIVCSLGAKLLYDRSVLPRVWARTVAYDPDSPFRGRYLSLRVEIDASRVFPQGTPEAKGDGSDWNYMKPVTLSEVNSKLPATPVEGDSPNSVLPLRTAHGMVIVLDRPVDFYIPENAPDPTRRPQGEELWVEVTIPRKGPPRPIRLGVKKDGKLTPLVIP